MAVSMDTESPAQPTMVRRRRIVARPGNSPSKFREDVPPAGIFVLLILDHVLL